MPQSHSAIFHWVVKIVTFLHHSFFSEAGRRGSGKHWSYSSSTISQICQSASKWCQLLTGWGARCKCEDVWRLPRYYSLTTWLFSWARSTLVWYAWNNLCYIMLYFRLYLTILYCSVLSYIIVSCHIISIYYGVPIIAFALSEWPVYSVFGVVVSLWSVWSSRGPSWTTQSCF